MSKSLRSSWSSLKRLNRAWSLSDTGLMLACVRAIADNHRAELPREIASVMGHRMLADYLCGLYGCDFEYPNVVRHRRKEKSVSLPYLKTIAKQEKP